MNELRRSFLAPIPEIEHVADLLDKAADALLDVRHDAARTYLAAADISGVYDYASRIMGALDDEIHRYRPLADKAVNRRDAFRMPGKALSAAILRRDGYRCRFCGCKVVMSSSQAVFSAFLPGSIRWGSRNHERHAGYFALAATWDHVVPHSHGGTNDESNIVTTCQPCNFGKGRYLLEELSLADPRDYAPVCDGWDGLERLQILRQKKTS